MADLKLTTYEINKMAMAAQPELTDQQFSSHVMNMSLWFSARPNSYYFMFLCRERNDYTIFNFKEPRYEDAKRELKQLILSRGKPVSIDYDHDNDAYEIWVRTQSAQETTRPKTLLGEEKSDIVMYRLFRCDDFIIEIQ